MPVFEDFYFDSSTGKNRIHARKCIPDTTPRAVIQIAHGIAEHINRYDDFMSYLASNGFLAVGNDHLGHGQSIEAPANKGFFAAKNGWSYAVKDMVLLHDIMKKEAPDIPYIIFGHSMGSFLTRTYIIDYPEKYDAVIISGTGQQAKGLVASGHAMASAATLLCGPHKVGNALNNIAFGSYNDGFENPRTPFDWLSRDESSVDKYIADPLCGFAATVSLYRDMMGGIKYIGDQKNINKMSKDKPVYFMSGSADPVGDNGKGVEKAYKAFLKAGLKDVFMRLYPDGRHEMLNEINKDAVYSDILNWLNEKLDRLKA